MAYICVFASPISSAEAVVYITGFSYLISVSVECGLGSTGRLTKMHDSKCGESPHRVLYYM